MENGYKKIVDGYLYKIQDDTLVEYPGEVIVHERRNKMMSSSRRGRALFCVSNEVRSSYKNLTVCINEGEVYNGMVWLCKSDWKRAAEIFRDYSARKIAELGVQRIHYQKIRDEMNDLIFDSLEV